MLITVCDILCYIATGMTHQLILSDFTCLTGEDLRACLSYAAESQYRTLVSQV